MMHGERYPDATAALAAVEARQETIRLLRAALNEKSRECEELKLELKKRDKLAIDRRGLRLASEERQLKGD
jgi:predicted RNase H-like nuclease (RuvC/YqgF family)